MTTRLATTAALLGLAAIGVVLARSPSPMGPPPARTDAELLTLLRPTIEQGVEGCFLEGRATESADIFVHASLRLTGGSVVSLSGDEIPPEVVACIVESAEGWASPERIELELPIAFRVLPSAGN